MAILSVVAIAAIAFQANAGPDGPPTTEGSPIHSYENTGDEPFEFLCIIPNKEDKITIVEEAC